MSRYFEADRIELRNEDYDLDFLSSDSSDDVVDENAIPYKIMVVDDDESMHAATRMLLKDFSFGGARLEFIDAFSGKEAIQMFKDHPDIAVIFLDVVMETNDAGLRIIDHIRNVVGNSAVRIILRTGMPGEAPEEMIIAEYEINDYRLKTELTVKRMYSILFEALRSFRDIRRVELERDRLKTLVKATSSLFAAQDIDTFATYFFNSLPKIGAIDTSGIMEVRFNGLVLFEKMKGDFRCAVRSGICYTTEEQLIESKSRKACSEGGEIVASSNKCIIHTGLRDEYLMSLCIEGRIDLFDVNRLKEFMLTYGEAMVNIVWQLENSK